jgi:hypothetical protein
MKLLVLTTEPITADQLRAAASGDVEPDNTEVVVVAPAVQDSALRFWFSDADDAIARADEVQRESLEQLEAEGFPASADTGESDPESAIVDALQRFPADRILIFTHPEGQKKYREGIDPDELQRRVGIPVRVAELAPDSSG